MYAEKVKTYPVSDSKHNANREKQVILLIIPNGEKRKVNSKERKAKSEGRRWHHLAVKILSAWLIGVTLTNNGGFYCLNCPHSFKTKIKLESHKKVYENKIFCNVVMPSEDTKILEFNNIKNLIKHHFLFRQILKV